MNKRILLLILIFLNLATIFFFSHQSAETSSALSDSISHQLEIRTKDYENKTQGEKNGLHVQTTRMIRRWAHVLLFFSLGVLVLLWIHSDSIRWYFLLGGAVFGVLCAFGDEFHQLYVPGRTFEWEDISHDVQGYLAGMVLTALTLAICYLVKKHTKRAEN